MPPRLDAPLALRPSGELLHWPLPPATPALIASPARPLAAMPQAEAEADDVAVASPLPSSSWLLLGTALLAGAGWLVERRRRLLLETEKDSVLWADVQPPGPSIVTTAHGLDDILPDSPNPAESARAIYVTAIAETTSRREATLIDLHQLDGKLVRRRDRGDAFAAVLLLQQHLADFRYTSPWVFLELRELYKGLERRHEWDVARQAFRHRFGQNAPAWDAPTTAGLELAADKQLCGGLTRHWPHREARMFVLRWMLGENEMRQKCSGPPLLGLGVYRDLLFLDTLLDRVMAARPALTDSLL